MAYKKTPIPLMQEGFEKEVLQFVYKQIQAVPGLQHFINQYGGVNAKWFNPDVIYNDSIKKFIRLLLIKFIFQDEDTLLSDWNRLFDLLYSIARSYPNKICSRHSCKRSTSKNSKK